MDALAEIILIALWLRVIVLTGLGVARHRQADPPPTPACGPITALVPAYNEASGVADTVRSLEAALLHPDSALVLVDDGSTDETARLAHAAATPERLIVLRLSPNQGKAAALNAGLAAARTDLIATIDADTMISPEALAFATAKLHATRTQAAAFNLHVAAPRNFLQHIQQQEYLASLGFERAGQDLLGFISVLPGAATLFRADALAAHPFSARTSTEDADLTLTLAGAKAGSTLAIGAIAETHAPATLRALITQRLRWTGGHLQCCARHWPCAFSANARLTYLNFLIATLAPLFFAFAFAIVVAKGATPLLGLEVWAITAISLALVYAQRATANLATRVRPASLLIFFFEPAISSALVAISFVGALVWGLWRWMGARSAGLT